VASCDALNVADSDGIGPRRDERRLKDGQIDAGQHELAGEVWHLRSELA
jgi:hypothetical protein